MNKIKERLTKHIYNLCISFLSEEERIYGSGEWNNFIKKDVCIIAARNGWLELLKWAIFYDHHFDGDVCRTASKYGHLNILKYLHEKNYMWASTHSYNVFTVACIYNHLDILMWMVNNNYGITNMFYRYALEHNNLEMIKWGKQVGLLNDCSALVCSGAAYHGHFEILEWAHKNGCDWNEKVCVNAIRSYNKNKKIIEWLNNNDCPCKRRYH